MTNSELTTTGTSLSQKLRPHLAKLRGNAKSYFCDPAVSTRIGYTSIRALFFPLVAYLAYLGLIPALIGGMAYAGELEADQIGVEIAANWAHLFPAFQNLQINALQLAGFVLVAVLLKDVLLHGQRNIALARETEVYASRNIQK